MDENFQRTQFQRCWNRMGLGCWVKQKGGKPGFMKLCRHVGPRLRKIHVTHFARSGHGYSLVIRKDVKQQVSGKRLAC